MVGHIVHKFQFFINMRIGQFRAESMTLYSCLKSCKKYDLIIFACAISCKKYLFRINAQFLAMRYNLVGLSWPSWVRVRWAWMAVPMSKQAKTMTKIRRMRRTIFPCRAFVDFFELLESKFSRNCKEIRVAFQLKLATDKSKICPSLLRDLTLLLLSLSL